MLNFPHIVHRRKIRLSPSLKEILICIFNIEHKWLIFDIGLVIIRHLFGIFCDRFQFLLVKLYFVKFHRLVGIEVSRWLRVFFHFDFALDARNGAHFVKTVAGLTLLNMALIRPICVYAKTHPSFGAFRMHFFVMVAIVN